jgi:gamma-glutamyltranspeptidase/glutathione hydrolase
MVLGTRGMVCTSQPLASFAGAEVLRGGGNAVDAAVAAGAVLGVVEPFSTGIGGDCFMLVWSVAEQKLFGLNGSGRAPKAASLESFQQRGLQAMPTHGMLPVTVPGAVAAWEEALSRFGARSLADALQPAIEYAENGFPVSEIISQQWALSAGLLQNDEARQAFTVNGNPPALGQIVRLPGLARTLRLITQGGAGVFYRGEVADEIVACSEKYGGLLAAEDLREHRSSWVEPIRTDYRGYEVFEIPPNSQGIAALIALNILEQFDLVKYELESPEQIHLRIEAIKLAFADRNRFVADPDRVRVPTEELLSKDYAQGRAAQVRLDRVLRSVSPGRLNVGTDTVYLTTADCAGNVVSLINSLFFPFGSGIGVGDTGIILQNRGFGFSLDPAHPNCIAAGKRPFHTIIPAMMFKNGRPLVSFGVMGGDMQAQGHVQVVSNLVDGRCNIQEALDRPRFHYLAGNSVALEPKLRATVGSDLARIGHLIEDEIAALAYGGFGGGQGIMIDPVTGAYWGGSDERKDGCAVGF